MHARSTALLVVVSMLSATLLVYIDLANTFQLASAQEQQEGAQLTDLDKNHSFARESESADVTAGAIEEEEEINEELRKIWDADVVLRSLALRNQSDLPALTASFSEDNEQHLKSSQNYFYHLDDLNDKYRISDVGLMALVAKSQSMVYGDQYTHRYDNFQDLKLAAGPKVDNEQCIKQLEALSRRADEQVKDKYRSKDINLFQLLDTWAHWGSGLLVGNAFMEGTYHECLRLRIDTGQSRLPTRYCVASFKHIDWPKIDKYDISSLKGGVCLPKSCDSSNYKNKYQLILRLTLLNMRVFEQNQVKFHSLYCLPDEDSPLRSVTSSPKALIVLSCLIAWMVALLYCTYKHQQMRHIFEKPSAPKKKFGLTNMDVATHVQSHTQNDLNEPEGSSRFRIYQMLSITSNIENLFNTSKESSLIEKSEQLAGSSKSSGSGAMITHQQEEEERLEVMRKAIERQIAGEFVDLSCIEGIKVIAMTYVVIGHVLMCITTIIKNGRDLASQGSMAFYLANLVPAFAVNGFFTITGMLTCYLMFKQNHSKPFITAPSLWLAFIVYRYLRIMPMYALAVLYCKTLAKYIGSGPLWDYATSSLGQRRRCESESWSWTLLFQSNFISPMEHCIPGGWYLSNDFQFFLVTPFFLALLYKRPRLGKAVLYASIVAGYLNSFYSIFSSSMSDFRPIAMFSPHGFKTYVSHFSSNYTHPQHRIPAYLVGLLIGYNLFCFERNKIEYHTSKRLARGRKSDEHQKQEQTDEPDWSESFKKCAIPISLSLVALCCATPLIGSMLPFNKASARLMVALITPSYHVLFGSAVGLYLLLATTSQAKSHLNALLSAKFWKPLARVSLCAVLVNVEVINYIIQTNPTLHYFTNQYQVALNIICILATYAVAIVVCVLFEAPIRAALNSLLTYAIARAARNQRERGKQD